MSVTKQSAPLQLVLNVADVRLARSAEEPSPLRQDIRSAMPLLIRGFAAGNIPPGRGRADPPVLVAYIKVS